MAEVLWPEHTHCWHAIEALMSNPPKFQEVCCHCGEKRQKPIHFGTPVKHGPFAPGALGTAQERTLP